MSLRGLFLQHLAQTSDMPLQLEVSHSEGMYLYSPDGRRYMDLIAGIGVSCLGHRHPVVVKAIHEQVDRYLHTMVYGEYVLAPQVQLATALVNSLPLGLDSVYLVNSGAEATEGAMKLAKRHTGRSELIACRNAYHGSTQGAASLNSDPYFVQAYRPLLPGIRHIDFNDFEDLEQISSQTAAVILETVQAESGIHKPAAGYLQQLRQKCSETGALLILDEIQAGFGRTGTLYAFEQYDIVPDVLLLAKGLGGGMPIGAFIAPRKIMHSLSEQPILGHITTFGGHPVSCAAALATLQTLLQENLPAQVAAKEALFRELLVHPAIKAVRSAGLWMAVELADFATVQTVVRHCLDRGLIIDWFLFNSKSLRIAPPLNISTAEIRWACDVLLEALSATQSC